MESRIPDRVRRNIPSSVAVVGVGGIGSWIALFFSEFSEVSKIALFDSDTLERSNLERTPYKMEHLGEQKTEAMKELIEERRRNIEVLAYGDIEEGNKSLLNFYDLKIAGADSVEARNLVLRQDNSISAGYDVDEETDHLTVSEDSQIWAVDDDGGGYTIDPSWSAPAVMGAWLVVWGTITGKRPLDISTSLELGYKPKGGNNRAVFKPDRYLENEEKVRQRDRKDAESEAGEEDGESIPASWIVHQGDERDTR